ncbi:MAG: hypothetical protein A2V98_26675 [Planctomycetes bacterium RBG_16_64_12]|nr:MAG: hypothetical protein A2V98_26675 [Planctomycetes bacterium RBG_16_64_12]
MKRMILTCLAVACCQMAFAQEPVPVPVAEPARHCLPAAPPSSAGDRLGHLLKAAEHLEAAGMMEEAVRLRGQIEEEKQALAARIEALQAEVDRLRGLVGGAQQVLVQVQMVEVCRSKLRELGFDFSQVGTDHSTPGACGRPAAGQPFEFGVVDDGDAALGVIEALRQDKLLRVLAEPTLVTLSGRPATMQVGDVVPAPVAQDSGAVAIEYRECGTRVDLLPTVFGNGRIRLEVRARVSKIDPSRTVQVQGQNCPGLNVREVATGVELNNGQTLILGGLVQNRPGEPVADTSARTYYASPAEHAAEKAGTAAEETQLLVLVRPEIVTSPEPKALGSHRPLPLPGARPAAIAPEAKRTAVPSATTR